MDTLPFALTFQDFARETAEIEQEYGPPWGAAWLVVAGSDPVGAVGLRRFEERSGEMKRMYVRPTHRGRGIGRLLGETLVAEARRIGYERVLLDTIDTMTEAIGLYRSMGFVESEPYRYNPIEGALYLELRLK